MQRRHSPRLALAGLLLALPIAAAAGIAKPRIAVLPFQNKADNQWWWHGGAAAMQDVFVTELVKSGRFRVIEREALAATARKNGVALPGMGARPAGGQRRAAGGRTNLTLSGDIDPATAVRAGKLLGVEYLLTGSVTEYGKTDAGVRGSRGGRRSAPQRPAGKGGHPMLVTARIFDVSTGEILWAAQARVSVFGMGGGAEERATALRRSLAPVAAGLVAKAIVKVPPPGGGRRG